MHRVEPVLSETSLSHVRTLFREYSRIPGVAPCVEDFEREVVELPGAYAPPGGRLLLAVEVGSSGPGAAVGCVALRRWEEQTCEMKRLYVRPEFRGKGAAHELVNRLIQEARTIGYSRIILDTLPSMKQAHKLYQTLGFRQCAAYNDKAIPGALFFELLLH